MSTIREAILKAADHIERHPSAFDFMTTEVPGDCGSIGCVIGWIAFFHPQFAKRTCHVHELCRAMLGIEGPTELWSATFYTRLYEIDEAEGLAFVDLNTWRHNACRVPITLRKYADKYHPARAVMPQSVREIFKPEEASCETI